MSSTALLALLLFQAPQLAPQESPEHVVIELTTGGRLEGTIVAETEDFIEIRMGARSVVGFERSKIANIMRQGGKKARAEHAGALEPRDEWFVLHDAEGRVVGRMHSTVLEDDEGRIRVGEEWEFRGKRESSEITLLEVINLDLTPVSSFFHERQTRRVDGQVVRESLVRGVVVGDQFVVDKKGEEKPERTVYPVDANMRFPLSLLQSVRQRSSHASDETWVVFDARTSEFTRRKFSASQRKVQWRDEVVHVSEVRHGAGRRQNTEWLDASCRTLRREINGPSLVAMPIEADMTERYLMSSEPVFPPAVAVEPSSKFALWLPSPAWQIEEDGEKGRITVREPVNEASACLVAFEQLPADTVIDTAADTVTRWLHQASEVAVAERDHIQVRDRDAIRLRGGYVERVQGGPREFKSEVYVFPANGVYVALCFTAPKLKFDGLHADFKRMLESVDLYPVPDSDREAK